jgi:anti-sigma-K factor RskA
MSGTGDEAPDMRAAEYVIGVLDAAEAAAAERLIAGDPAFAAEVADWERRLMPLTALAAPAPAPADLFDRIEASIGAPAASRPQRAANDNRRLAWPAAAIAAMAVAAGLAAFIVLRPVPPPVVAVLLPAAGGAPVLVAVAEPSGRTLVRATSTIAVAPDRDLELWAMKAGATRPESLGVIPPAGREAPANLAPGTMLLVSLEPKGGSPTGQPTGPVLYAGKLTLYN